MHSLEVFAADGELIAQLFGARKPGRLEDSAWTALLDGVAEREAHVSGP